VDEINVVDVNTGATNTTQSQKTIACANTEENKHNNHQPDEHDCGDTGALQ